ncbi:hypothetical protein Glove_707g102 [Diversispora epigaea]|uniref:DUF659 domain-containing protein n=1 Tax=Diversispora epigaea TaxID=1348612 RepID=A0A397G5P4_9GLOM|nr:hypothetical protein Glove_707g102 [Diversispora epigaea]
MKKKLSNETNLTLGLDGWTSPAGQSLYIFLIMTSDGKEYIHSLKNFSKNSHTGEFLKNEIIKVIEEVGAEKSCSIVSDHASNVVLAKNLVSTKYPHIFPIRCIAHHINLLSTTNIITCCKKIVTFFKQSHAGGAILQQEIVENMIKGGGLKKYVITIHVPKIDFGFLSIVITRWTTVYDCTDSIIRCKNALKQILENESQLLNLEIISILRKQNFFRNVKDLRTILLPIKKAIINLEHKSTTLADFTDDKQRRCSRALTKFFVTCGVPLWIVENPFFIDYSKELCSGFQVPKRTILFTTIINVETATVIAEMKKKLSNETNLTLGLDGWTSPAGQSLYIFLIMTSDGKEYIHSLKNFSKNSHTGEFLKNEIIKVIEEVGAEKSCSIVSDHASNVVLAKNLVSTKYPHIFPIRCIAHHINLLSSDIIKLN